MPTSRGTIWHPGDEALDAIRDSVERLVNDNALACAIEAFNDANFFASSSEDKPVLIFIADMEYVADNGKPEAVHREIDMKDILNDCVETFRGQELHQAFQEMLESALRRMKEAS